MKTFRNISFVIFDSHLTQSRAVWAQNIDTVNRLIILQKKALRIMNFKDQLFHPTPLFSENCSDKITLENILFVNKSINRQVPLIYMTVSNFQEICTDSKLACLYMAISTYQLFGPKILSLQYKNYYYIFMELYTTPLNKKLITPKTQLQKRLNIFLLNILLKSTTQQTFVGLEDVLKTS